MDSLLFNQSMKTNCCRGILFVFWLPPRTKKWSGPVTAGAPVLPLLVPCCGTAASPPASLCLCDRDLCPRAAVIQGYRAFKRGTRGQDRSQLYKAVTQGVQITQRMSGGQNKASESCTFQLDHKSSNESIQCTVCSVQCTVYRQYFLIYNILYISWFITFYMLIQFLFTGSTCINTCLMWSVL